MAARRGDALITVKVSMHPVFRREGDDVHVDLPVTVKEAVLGGRVTVPTVTGSVAMTVPRPVRRRHGATPAGPRCAGAGQRGRGRPTGDAADRAAGRG